MTAGSYIYSGLLCRIDAVCEESSSKEEEECVICMDRKASVILPCAHAYCEQCIEAWLVHASYCCCLLFSKYDTI